VRLNCGSENAQMDEWNNERRYRIRNEYVSGRIGVASLVDKMRENRLEMV